MESTRGILEPAAGAARFALERRAPSPALSPLVAHFWLLRWSLDAPFEQQTLPHPSVNLVAGTHRPGLHGVCTRRFCARLEGDGWVVAARFRPGAFRLAGDFEARALADQERSLGWLLGASAAALEAPLGAERGALEERLRLLEALVQRVVPPPDEDGLRAASLVELAQADASLKSPSALAEAGGVGLRSLERLFRARVGVSPRWVLRRSRIQEAAERAAAGEAPRWSALAAELGFSDQAHFSREFKAHVGLSPVAYAARCSAQG